MTLLLFLDSESLSDRISMSLELPKEIATEISGIINESLFYTVSDILTEFDNKFSTTNQKADIPDIPNTAVAPEPTSAQSEIPAVTPPPEVPPETELETVSPLRTMSGDIQKVHGYGALAQQHNDAEDEPVHSSSQTETLTDLPSYTEEKE